MKEWKKPEVKIFDVKLDENIAASGENNYEKVYIYYADGPITRGGDYFYCSGKNIQDTGIPYEVDMMNLVDISYQRSISGCLA